MTALRAPTARDRGRKEPTDTCNAKKRGGDGEGFCRLPAGWGTSHVGEGRCKLHGGSNPIKHGRYSRYTRTKLGEEIERLQEDPDPLDLKEEVHLARALLQRALDRKELEERDQMSLVSEVSKIVKRIEDIRSQDAVSRPELARIWSEMLRVVQMECEEEQARRIAEGWKQIRL